MSSTLDEDDTLGNQYLMRAKLKMNQYRQFQTEPTLVIKAAQITQNTPIDRIRTQDLKKELIAVAMNKQKSTINEDVPTQPAPVTQEEDEQNQQDNSNNDDHAKEITTPDDAETEDPPQTTPQLVEMDVSPQLAHLDELIKTYQDNAKIQSAQIEQFTKLLHKLHRMVEKLDDERQQEELYANIKAAKARLNNHGVVATTTSSSKRSSTTSTRGRAKKSTATPTTYDFGYDNGEDEDDDREKSE